MHVLYVDDDPIMTAAVQRMFDGEDFQCEACDLGETAVDLAKQDKYDIILLDVMLPDIDGYEVISRLRRAGVGTPVLLQSGLVDRENDIDGLWLGATDYLLKPFNKRELFERIQAVLSRPADSGPQDPVRLSQVSAPADQERDRRRRHRRFETVQPGRIIHNGGIDCLILDMSYGGAALQLPDPNADCPESFDLLLQSGATLRCRVRWRSGDRIGIQGEALFPDEVVTEFLKQGEAAVPEAPELSPPEAAGDEPSSEGPAQSPEQSGSPAASAAETPTEPGPDPDALPDHPAPAAPQPATAAPLPRAAPHEAATEASISEPKTVGFAAATRQRETSAQQPQQGPEPVSEDPARELDQPKPPDQAADGGGLGGQVFNVDRGTRLVAEVCDCEELVVEGHLQASARARRLRLGRDGCFQGTAEVEVAEIEGRYEGNLIVTGRLVIFAGATVSGTTRYRQIVIEAGGGLLGQVQLLPKMPGDAIRHGTKPREATPATPPLAAQA